MPICRSISFNSNRISCITSPIVSPSEPSAVHELDHECVEQIQPVLHTIHVGDGLREKLVSSGTHVISLRRQSASGIDKYARNSSHRYSSPNVAISGSVAAIAFSSTSCNVQQISERKEPDLGEYMIDSHKNRNTE